MKKIRLDLAALKVISFEPARQSDAQGTVKGHDDASNFRSCYPDNVTCGTCGRTCEPGSCGYTCDVGLTGEPCVFC
jgi:hypothetical protein